MARYSMVVGLVGSVLHPIGFLFILPGLNLVEKVGLLFAIGACVSLSPTL